MHYFGRENNLDRRPLDVVALGTENKNRSNIINLFALRAQWKYNIIKVLCFFFFTRPTVGGGWQNAMIYFGRRDWRREGWKWSEKLTPTVYHCCRRAEGIRLPLSYYALAADSSRFVYIIIIIITINFYFLQTSSNGLSLSLSLSLTLSVSVSFALRSRI